MSQTCRSHRQFCQGLAYASIFIRTSAVKKTKTEYEAVVIRLSNTSSSMFTLADVFMSVPPMSSWSTSSCLMWVCSPMQIEESSTDTTTALWKKSVEQKGDCEKRASTSLCTHKRSQTAGPFSVARLKMDLPFHNRLALKGELPALLRESSVNAGKCSASSSSGVWGQTDLSRPARIHAGRTACMPCRTSRP